MVTPLKCDCGATVPSHVRNCVECEEDVGYPNVRAAESLNEVEALSARYDNALVSARASGYEVDLLAFGQVASEANAVIARSLETLLIVTESNSLLTGYHHQVASGGRVPADNRWDRGRTSAENSVHPNYFEDIQYCALSLDGVGVAAWGDCHITLSNRHIQKRASVFEENVFKFCEDKGVVSGKEAPSGFRAPWDKRGRLAQVKLHHHLAKHPPADQYKDILIYQGTDTGNAEFIEVHVYGGLHMATFDKVTVVHSEDTDKHLVRIIERRLKKNNIPLVLREAA